MEGGGGGVKTRNAEHDGKGREGEERLQGRYCVLRFLESMR